MQSALNAPHLTNEAAAFEYVEARLWPHGPVCPHCSVVGEASKANGKTTRAGLWNCRACRKPFTVRMGSIFESSHVPMHVWLQAIYLICSSKKGISTRQMQRTLGGSMKTAWFLMHRIREAMRDGELAPMGGGGGIVEADETFFGRDPDAAPNNMGWRNKNAILTLVDRTTGRARSTVMPVDRLNAAELSTVLTANVSREARLMTDEARHYMPVGKLFADHQSVTHARGEYVRRQEPTVHSNTVEGFYSVFKRGMVGVYQHCAKSHLHRYAGEFDFRYTYRSARGVEDAARADLVLKGAVGKRLTYQTVGGTGAAASDGPQTPLASWDGWEPA